jgi:hypothetical protein
MARRVYTNGGELLWADGLKRLPRVKRKPKNTLKGKNK